MAEKQVSKRGRPVGTRMATVELDTLSFKAPKEFADRVRRYSKEHRVAVSELVRDGLEWRISEASDPRNWRPRAESSGETTYEGNTGNTDTSQLRLMLQQELRAFFAHAEGVIDAIHKAEHVASTVAAPSVTGNTGITSVDGDIPVASMEAQSTSWQAPVGEDTREGIPSYDPAKHHLGKLCKRGHAWGDTGQSLKNADNQCLECKALAKREKDAKKRAEREAQPVAG